MSTSKYNRKKLIKDFVYVPHQAACKLFDRRLEIANILLIKYEELMELNEEGKCFDHDLDYCYDEMRNYLEIIRDYLEILVRLKNHLKDLEVHADNDYC